MHIHIASISVRNILFSRACGESNLGKCLSESTYIRQELVIGDLAIVLKVLEKSRNL